MTLEQLQQAYADLAKRVADLESGLRETPKPARRKTEKTDFDPVKVPGLNVNAWTMWIDYRVKIGKPLKAVSLPIAAQRLAAHGDRQQQAVEHSMGSGYQGLWDQPQQRGAQKQVPLSYEQKQAAELEVLKSNREKLGIPGFRDPLPRETPSQYRMAQDDAWTKEQDRRRANLQKLGQAMGGLRQ